MNVEAILAKVDELNVAERHQVLQHIIDLNRSDAMKHHLDSLKSRTSDKKSDELITDVTELSLGDSEDARESMRLLQEIWDALPPGAGAISDEEIDRMKLEWRLEKYG